MKKILLISVGIAVLIAVSTGIYYMLQLRSKGLSFYGHGPLADVQNLMSEIPTLKEYAAKDPEILRNLGFDADELKKSLETKQKLLQEGIQKLLENGDDVSQLLDTAYIYKHHAIINLLLESGVDINTRENQFGGVTVLHRAAEKGDIEMLKFFIERGADVNGTDSVGTPVLQAAIVGGPEIISLLIEYGADVTKDDTLLHSAVLTNKEDIVRILLKHGASVNTKDALGRTPLFYTTYAFIGDQAIVPEDRHTIAELLIAHKADIMAKDNYNETPLHAAALWGSNTVASTLMQHGADIEAQDNRGFTPLFMAALGSGKTNSTTFNLLKTHKVNINHATKDGVTILHVTTRPDIAQGILDQGIDINVKDDKGLTPLDYASGSNRELLYTVSYLGVIPYNLFGNNEIINFLKEHGGKTHV